MLIFWFSLFQRHWYLAMRPGALKDAVFLEMLDEELEVFEGEEPFSIRSTFGMIIPGPEVARLVGCCYRLSAGYPMVDWYYTRLPEPMVVDLAMPSTPASQAWWTERRRRPRARPPPPPPPRPPREAEAKMSGGDGEETVDSELLLKENENTLRELGVAMETLVKKSTTWVAARGGRPLLRLGYTRGQCLGHNWIAMDVKESTARLLPCATMVRALLGPSEPREIVDSSAEPLLAPGAHRTPKPPRLTQAWSAAVQRPRWSTALRLVSCMPT